MDPGDGQFFFMDQKINEQDRRNHHRETKLAELEGHIPDGQARKDEIGLKDVRMLDGDVRQKKEQDQEVEQSFHDDSGERAGKGDAVFFSQEVGAQEFPGPRRERVTHEPHHQWRIQAGDADFFNWVKQNPPPVGPGDVIQSYDRYGG